MLINNRKTNKYVILSMSMFSFVPTALRLVVPHSLLLSSIGVLNTRNESSTEQRCLVSESGTDSQRLEYGECGMRTVCIRAGATQAIDLD